MSGVSVVKEGIEMVVSRKGNINSLKGGDLSSLERVLFYYYFTYGVISSYDINSWSERRR